MQTKTLSYLMAIAVVLSVGFDANASGPLEITSVSVGTWTRIDLPFEDVRYVEALRGENVLFWRGSGGVLKRATYTWDGVTMTLGTITSPTGLTSGDHSSILNNGGGSLEGYFHSCGCPSDTAQTHAVSADNGATWSSESSVAYPFSTPGVGDSGTTGGGGNVEILGERRLYAQNNFGDIIMYSTTAGSSGPLTSVGRLITKNTGLFQNQSPSGDAVALPTGNVLYFYTDGEGAESTLGAVGVLLLNLGGDGFTDQEDNFVHVADAGLVAAGMTRLDESTVNNVAFSGSVMTALLILDGDSVANGSTEDIFYAPITISFNQAIEVGEINTSFLSESGWFSDDTRADGTGSEAIGTNLISDTLTDDPEATLSGSPTHDGDILLQIPFVSPAPGTVPAGTHLHSVHMSIDSGVGSGKSQISHRLDDGVGHAPGSSFGPGFSAEYSWMGDGTASVTASLKFGVKTADFGSTGVSSRTGENVWDKIMIYEPGNLNGETSDSMWHTETIDYTTGKWWFFDRTVFGSTIGTPMTLSDMSTSAVVFSGSKTIADVYALITAPGAHITSAQFGIGSGNAGGSVYVNQLVTNFYRAGDTTTFGDLAPPAVVNIDTAEGFATIQEAIDDPDTLNGHTIEVSAGTYAESITVDKALTLLGANAGVCATSRVSAGDDSIESIIDLAGITGGFVIKSSDVTIDGFEIAGDADTSFGIYIAASGDSLSTIDLVNNLIHGMGKENTGNTSNACYCILADAKDGGGGHGNIEEVTIDCNELYEVGGVAQDCEPDGPIPCTSTGLGVSLHEIGVDVGGFGVAITNNSFHDIASGDIALTPVPGIAIAQQGHLSATVPSTGVSVSDNTYADVEWAVLVFADTAGSTIAEANASFTDVTLKIINIGSTVPTIGAVVDEGILAPFAKSDSWSLIASTEVYTCTIQEAIDISDGTIIDVSAGTFVENIVIDSNLTLRGAGSADTIIDASGGSNGILITAGGDSVGDRLTIEDLQVTGATGNGIRAHKAGGLDFHFVTFERLIVTLSGSHGVELHNEVDVSDLEVLDCDFSDNGGVGMRTSSSTSLDGLLVEDSHFNGGTYGIYLTAETINVTIRNSTLNGNSQRGYWGSNGEVSNLLIEDCEANDNDLRGITVWSYDAVNGIDGVTIRRTTMNDNGQRGFHTGAATDGSETVATTIANMLLDNCALKDNGVEGFHVDLGLLSNVAIHDSNLSGNGSFGLRHDNSVSSGTVDATDNWWGDTSGPLDISSDGGETIDLGVCTITPEAEFNTGGAGTAIGDNSAQAVDFCPWLEGSGALTLEVSPTTCQSDTQITVELWMRDLVKSATGFFTGITYDTGVLAYRDDLSSYTVSPFPLHITSLSQPDDGLLQLDGSESFGGPGGASDDALLATLVFDVVSACASTDVTLTSSAGFSPELSFEGSPLPTNLVDTGAMTLDDTDPVITFCPDVEIVECDGSGNAAELAAWLDSFTATDTCSGPTLTNDFGSLSDDCGETGTSGTVTFTATDDCGNFTDCTSTFTIEDETDPSITCPEDVTVECDESTDPSDTGTPGHFQGFEDPGFASGGPVIGGDFSTTGAGWSDFNSVLTRVASGTNGIASKSGGFHAEADSTSLPSAPDDFTGIFSRLGGYDSTFGGGYSVSLDVYMDLSDAAVAADTYGWDLTTAATRQTGSHLRDFIFHTASDASGDILVGGSNNTNFTRRNDIATLNHYTITSSGWYTFEWVFRDFGDGSLAVDLNLLDAGGTWLWTETRNTAADVIATIVGGHRYMWFTFLELDVLAIDNTTVSNSTQATDACDSSVVITFDDVESPGACDQEKTITRTWSAEDECGNIGTCDQIITVEDTTAPVLTPCPDDIEVNADAGGCDAVVNFSTPTATDNCDPTPVVTCDWPSGSMFPTGTTLVTCTAEDDCDNTSDCSFNVTVNGVNDVVIEIELAGVTSEPTRCIHFLTKEAGDFCGLSDDVELTFDSSGIFSGTVELKCGDWTEVCVKDEQHTLYDTATLTDTGTSFSATAVSLSGGDTDNDSDIDINDVTLFLAQFGDLALDGDCPWDGTRDADFSDNGAVGSEDYTLLTANWLTSSSCSCTIGLNGGPDDSVFKLATSLDAAALPADIARRADLNADGKIDYKDVREFERQNGLPNDLSSVMEASEKDKR